jgi:hypothetical protein
MIVWPDLECRGTPEIFGAARPDAPPPQQPPRNGTAPRVDFTRVAERGAALPSSLLAWVDDDGFPLMIPTAVAGTEARGIRLDLPAGVAPVGDRRAGLLSHRFERYTAGQVQRRQTGWLEVAHAGAASALYAPHTDKGYRMPASMVAYRLSAGAVTRRGYRSARRAGLVPGAAR